jgi:hypothetical protein
MLMTKIQRKEATEAGGSRPGTVVAMAMLACLLLSGILASPSAASQAIDSFEVTSTSTQAGGHPDLGMSFSLDAPGAPESARNVAVNTPEGVFGNPNAITRCSSVDFALTKCPSSSQAGLITVRANHGGVEEKLLGTAPIFIRVPEANQTALFAFVVPTLNIPVSIPVTVRSASDYGLRFTVSELTQLAPLAKANLVFWGFPADETNDDQRFPKGSPGNPAGCPGLANSSCIKAPVAAALEVRPMINNPSACTSEPPTVSIQVVTYQDPSNPTEAQSSYPTTTGCYNMTFKPVLLGTPTSSAADSPAGLDLQMSAAQPLGRATTPSPIRAATLTLPEGLTINPDAADGQTACPDVLAGFGEEDPANCPDSAKIGTFAVGSPSLDGPLEGSIYIGEPKPGDQYRAFLIADGFGIHAKFVASFHPDPVTGRVTAVIDSLPQVSFETFDLHLFASDRGLVATPTRCGIYEIGAHYFPWNDRLADRNSKQNFSINSGPNGAQCPGEIRPFNPTLVAGTSNPSAGAFSSFSLQLDRDDGDQFLGDLNFRMPPGFTGDLRGITYCPEASISAAAQNPGLTERAFPSCPASSKIGTTNVAAGPGSHPFHAVGEMYLAGPFKGAPLSLAAVTPALAGPYDYGTQVVRVALHVDPLTAQVSAISDTVPSIIGGIPIRMRSIRVNIDRQNFTINPTSCSPMSIDSQGIGDQGTVANFSSPFNAGNCFSLPFKPRMTMRQVGSRRATRRARNPQLQIGLTTRPGDANIKSISVTLSSAFEIDQRHLGNICSEKELAAFQCAGRTPIGTAATTTPLLDQPLSGPVYAVSGSGGLPRLAFILNGQVTLVPRADTKSVGRGQLKTTVPVVPDAPIGHFELTVFGGKAGYLVNTRDICVHRPVTKIDYTGQNGKTYAESVKVKASCGKKSKKARHKRGAGR